MTRVKDPARPFRQTSCETKVEGRGQLRHSFVSLLSDSGVRIEDIADLCGNAGTTVTESVHRHQLRPVLLNGAVAVDRVFSSDAGPAR